MNYIVEIIKEDCYHLRTFDDFGTVMEFIYVSFLTAFPGKGDSISTRSTLYPGKFPTIVISVTEPIEIFTPALLKSL
jgi:hypothetical protein